MPVMPSAIYFLLVALHAITFLALSDFSRLIPFALASPLPLQMPSSRATDYRSPDQHSRTELDSSSAKAPPAVYSPAEQFYRRANDLYASYDKASSNAGNLKKLAVQSSAVGPDDRAFQNDCISELTAFQSNILGLQPLLEQLGADKGLKNYDGSKLETLIKNIVNLHKDVLESVTKLTYHIPILGPTLGPIVYQIKCIVDDILDFAENLADGVIGPLQPLLKPLLDPLLG